MILNTALIIAFTVLFINSLTWKGMIFEKPADWLSDHLPEWIEKPLFGCPICMSFWYGILILAIKWEGDLIDAVFTIFVAGGVSVISVAFVKFIERMNDDK